jgi:hypothetical protein
MTSRSQISSARLCWLTTSPSLSTARASPSGEDWKKRLGVLIRDADTIVFVLSPASARSPVCAWEATEAVSRGKRIIPILCRPLDGVAPPPELVALQYTYFYDDPKFPGSGFGTGLNLLRLALNSDLGWLREHTRYLRLAEEWEEVGKPSDRRLLSAADIALANEWIANRPPKASPPTVLQLDFVKASEEEDMRRRDVLSRLFKDIAHTQQKGVLLLGRFTEGGIIVLERLREELRKRDYLPIVFNSDMPTTKDFTETVRLLAGLSKFVIADITNPESAPFELVAIVSQTMIPFQPIIEAGETPFAMLQDLLTRYPDRVFPPIHYSSVDALIASLDETIIQPAEARLIELIRRKGETMGGKHI